MAQEVKKRQSIHHQDKKTTKESENQGVQQCKKCKFMFQLGDNKSEIKLDQKEDESITRNKCLEKEVLFLCSNCAKEEKLQTFSKPSSTFQGIRFLIFMLLVLFGIVIITFSLTYFMRSSDVERIKILRESFDINMPKRSTFEIRFDNELEQLENMYKEQDEDVWYTLAAGIKSVLRENPNQPSVFLMLYDSDTAGITAKCLAQDVSKPATRFLMNQLQDPLLFHAQYFQSDESVKEDPGILIERLKNPIEKHGAMIVTDLQDMPPDIARQFHFFCDKYSPVVEKAIYFFTLKVQFTNHKPQEIAESKLKELWSHVMPDNYLNALITRLTPNILEISSGHSSC